MLAAVKKTTSTLLALVLANALCWPLSAAPLPDDLRGEDDETEAPAAKPVHPLERRPPPTDDPENPYLPPEIREDVEHPAPRVMPGEADSDDGTDDPEPEATPAPPAEAPELPKREPAKKPKTPVKPWKRPATPQAAAGAGDPAETPPAPKPKKSPSAASLAAKAERERKKAEQEAAREAAELARLNREAERKAAAEEKKKARAAELAKKAEERKAREAQRKADRAAKAAAKAAANQKPAPNAVALAPAPPAVGTGSDASTSAPLPDASARPPKKGRGKKDKTPPSPAPGASPAAPAPAKPEKPGKPMKARKRDTQYGRTGEEAPILVTAAARNAVAPAAAPAGYVEQLKTMLAALVDGARNPMEKAIAMPYLGFVGDKSRLPKMYEVVDDPKADDGEKLPVLAALVDGFDDRSRLPKLYKIADDPRTPPFNRVWALEILAQAGDRSRIAVAQRMIDDKAIEANERMRALQVLAELGDDSRRDVAKRLGNDQDLFLATRMQALACLARMEKNAKKGAIDGVSELKRVMQRSHLSVEERLSIALDLVQVGETSTRDFLERVVESESDTIFDQLRALHGLALLGVSEHLGLLQETFQSKKRPRNTARRILVLMGDRSRVPDLLEDAKAGDLEAVRTLVLAAVLDQQKTTTSALLNQPRYRTLIAP